MTDPLAVLATLSSTVAVVMMAVCGFLTRSVGQLRGELGNLMRDVAVIRNEVLPRTGLSLTERVDQTTTQLAVLSNNRRRNIT